MSSTIIKVQFFLPSLPFSVSFLLKKLLFQMAFKTFLGDEDELEIICDKRLSCVSAHPINFYLENQGWEGYIALL